MSQSDQIQNYYRLANLCGASQALLGARELGLFEAMEGPPKTVEDLAELCRVPARRLKLLLDVLVTTGAIEQYGDDYALSMAMRLINNHPHSLHGPHWMQLPDFLNNTTDDPPHDEQHHKFRADGFAVQWTLTAAAMELAEKLDIGQQRQGLNILDLGAGAAMWSSALAYRDPASRVTVVDHAEALEAAQRTCNEIGLEERAELLPGDYRVVELPADTFDLVLAVDLLQLQPLEKCRIWLEQVHQSLRAEGELVIVGRFPGNPRGDLQRTLASLELPIRVPEAETHDADAVQELLESMQFQVEPPLILDAPPYCVGAILARKQ